MPERKIDPKFNIHSSYRTLNILNPYRFYATYEPETLNYINRVETDGGEVIDKTHVNAFILKCKELNILDNLVQWTSSKAGIKKDANGLVSKMYSIEAISDGVQTDSFKQPLFNGNLVFDGDDDALFLGTVQAGSRLALGGGIGTIETRIKPQSGTRDDYMRIVDKSTGGNMADGYGVYLRTNGEFITQATNNSNPAIIVTNFQDDVYTDTCSVINGSNSKVFLNGTLQSTGSIPAIPDVTAEMRIGTWNHSTGREYKGEIDYLRIWDIPLTESQHNELRQI